MRLALYSSVPRGDFPNLVALQDEALAGLPTVLVCPFKTQAARTTVRVAVQWADANYIACVELTRPIRRTVLRPIGRLDEDSSSEIVERFKALLAR